MYFFDIKINSRSSIIIKTPIIIIENPDDYWTRLYYESENEYAFLRVIDRDTSIILGSFDNIQILIMEYLKKLI